MNRWTWVQITGGLLVIGGVGWLASIAVAVVLAGVVLVAVGVLAEAGVL